MERRLERGSRGGAGQRPASDWEPQVCDSARLFGGVVSESPSATEARAPIGALLAMPTPQFSAARGSSANQQRDGYVNPLDKDCSN